MNGAHIHLLLNHLPIMGAFISLPLLVLAMRYHTERGAFYAASVVVLLTGIGACAANWTGDGAVAVVKHLPEFQKALLHTHADHADKATVLAVLDSLGMLATLIYALKMKVAAPKGALGGVLAGAVLTAAAMAWTGYAGGMIRHTEIREGASVAAPAASGVPAEKEEGEDQDEDGDKGAPR